MTINLNTLKTNIRRRICMTVFVQFSNGLVLLVNYLCYAEKVNYSKIQRRRKYDGTFIEILKNRKGITINWRKNGRYGCYLSLSIVVTTIFWYTRYIAGNDQLLNIEFVKSRVIDENNKMNGKKQTRNGHEFSTAMKMP